MTMSAGRALQDGPVLNNGVKMPWLGLGVYRVKDGDEVIQAVKAAVRCGYRSIDTAAFYGNEKGVGQAIRECDVPRDQLFVATKVWNSDQGYESTLQAFEKSRKNLGLDVIDLYLVHWAVPGKYVETWKALVYLYREGVVRAIGVCNHQAHHLEEIIDATGVVPAVNQVELHPLLTQKELIAYCREHNIQTEAWRPLMDGNLDHPVLLDLGKKYGRTPAQIALRWSIENGVVVIPKSVHENRIIENAQIFDFSLSDEDRLLIDGMNENKRLGPDPDRVNF